MISFDDEFVRLRVHAPARALLLESAWLGWMRLSLEGQTLAWAKQAQHWQCLAWSRVRGSEPLAIIPPIRSTELRQSSWPAFYARALQASTRSPCSVGTWELGLIRERPVWAPSHLRGMERALHHAAAFRMPWMTSNANTVLALRTPSAPSSSRVKMWRKRARERVLPPLLLWWVAGLAAYVILDGHDRLQAASLEGVRCEVVSLALFREEQAQSSWMESELARYSRIFQHEGKLAPQTRIDANSALVESHAPYRRFMTHARFNPQLPSLFAHEAPALPDDVRAIFEEPAIMPAKRRPPAEGSAV